MTFTSTSSMPRCSHNHYADAHVPCSRFILDPAPRYYASQQERQERYRNTRGKSRANGMFRQSFPIPSRY
jgi:hypothetical protein